jgi:hypothetical protein
MRDVVRPLRNSWQIRRVVRRRHRTWMISMTFASLGWASWWVTAALLHWKPSWAPSIDVTDQLAITFALLGFIAAMLSIRARLGWLVVVAVPLFANLSVLLIPFTLNTWRYNELGQIVHDDDGTVEDPPGFRRGDALEHRASQPPVAHGLSVAPVEHQALPHGQ